MSTTSTSLAYSYDFQPLRAPRSSEVNANFASIATHVSSETLGSSSIKDGTFTAAKLTSDAAIAAKIQAGAVTSAKRGYSANITLGTAQDTWSSTTGGEQLITGSEVVITTNGRPVCFRLLPRLGEANTSVGIEGSGIIGVTVPANVRDLIFKRDSTVIAEFRPGLRYWPLSAHMVIDHPAAGTYTYRAYSGALTGSGALTLFDYRFVVYEID